MHHALAIARGNALCLHVDETSLDEGCEGCAAFISRAETKACTAYNCWAGAVPAWSTYASTPSLHPSHTFVLDGCGPCMPHPPLASFSHACSFTLTRTYVPMHTNTRTCASITHACTQAHLHYTHACLRRAMQCMHVCRPSCSHLLYDLLCRSVMPSYLAHWEDRCWAQKTKSKVIHGSECMMGC